MRCPFCGELESQVKDSRPSEDGAAIRRRRLCPECGGRFTTFERVQLRELTILKRSGRRAPFDREKLVRSISIATRKRPVDPERLERMVNGNRPATRKHGRDRTGVACCWRNGDEVSQKRSMTLRMFAMPPCTVISGRQERFCTLSKR